MALAAKTPSLPLQKRGIGPNRTNLLQAVPCRQDGFAVVLRACRAQRIRPTTEDTIDTACSPFPQGRQTKRRADARHRLFAGARLLHCAHHRSPAELWPDPFGHYQHGSGTHRADAFAGATLGHFCRPLWLQAHAAVLQRTLRAFQIVFFVCRRLFFVFDGTAAARCGYFRPFQLQLGLFISFGGQRKGPQGLFLLHGRQRSGRVRLCRRAAAVLFYGRRM